MARRTSEPRELLRGDLQATPALPASVPEPTFEAPVDTDTIARTETGGETDVPRGRLAGAAALTATGGRSYRDGQAVDTVAVRPSRNHP